MKPLTPPKLSELPYGYELVAGRGKSKIIADFDFETFSKAGFEWDAAKNRFVPPVGTKKKGLSITGSASYSEHDSAEVLSLAYNLKNGNGPQLWTPDSIGHPEDLFEFLAAGGLIEAWNAGFELYVWRNICVPRYGFPEFPVVQLRCAAAKARAFCLPGSLENAGDVLGISAKKDKDGKRLLDKFSIPRDPTKKDPRTRITTYDDLVDSALLYKYNLRDIEAEAEISSLTPDLSESELAFWQADLRINQRGAYVDLESVKNCLTIVNQAYENYNPELQHLTNNEVTSATQLPKLKAWLQSRGIMVKSLDADSLQTLMQRDLPPDIRRVLEIRELAGSSAVKKLYAMLNRSSKTQRLNDMFMYHAARTGRAAGIGPQPQNMPNSGLEVYVCNACLKHSKPLLMKCCPWCGGPLGEKVEWNAKAAEDTLGAISFKSLSLLTNFFSEPIAAVYSCLRSLIASPPGHDLICSDYSAIEAVCLAMISGEQWRIDIFNSHGKIYEASAAKIAGLPLETILLYKKETNTHHPLRKIGKVAELASGFSGGLAAWVRFGASEHLSEDEIKKNVYAWRDASPMIVRLWREMETAAKRSIQYPNTKFTYRGITFVTERNIMYCELLSGRHITYHSPRLIAGKFGDQIEFEGWNFNPLNGATGWVAMTTYGGRLVENIVQATARDILAHAIVNLENKGYPVVLHVHDEIVSEVKEEVGSLEEFENIMSTMPAWAKDWPIQAKGGWRRKRYGK